MPEKARTVQNIINDINSAFGAKKPTGSITPTEPALIPSTNTALGELTANTQERRKLEKDIEEQKPKWYRSKATNDANTVAYEEAKENLRENLYRRRALEYLNQSSPDLQLGVVARLKERAKTYLGQLSKDLETESQERDISSFELIKLWAQKKLVDGLQSSVNAVESATDYVKDLVSKEPKVSASTTVTPPEVRTPEQQRISELSALKLVLENKLENLMNDPRSYASLKDEIERTESELHTTNNAILAAIVGGENELKEITNKISVNKTGTTFTIDLNKEGADQKTLFTLEERTDIFDIAQKKYLGDKKDSSKELSDRIQHAIKSAILAGIITKEQAKDCKVDITQVANRYGVFGDDKSTITIKPPISAENDTVLFTETVSTKEIPHANLEGLVNVVLAKDIANDKSTLEVKVQERIEDAIQTAIFKHYIDESELGRCKIDEVKNKSSGNTTRFIITIPGDKTSGDKAKHKNKMLQIEVEPSTTITGERTTLLTIKILGDFYNKDKTEEERKEIILFSEKIASEKIYHYEMNDNESHKAYQEFLAKLALDALSNQSKHIAWEGSKQYTHKYLRDNLVDAGINVGNTDFDTLPDHVKQQILNEIFFANKNISISERLRRLSLTEAENDELLKRDAYLEQLQKTAAFNKSETNYALGTWGRFTAFIYAFSQVISLGCLLILMTVAFLSLVTFMSVAWWLILATCVLMIPIFISATGINNWWSFRNNVGALIIEIWNLFFNPVDVPYTAAQSFWLKVGFAVCFISGFLAGYFVYMFVAATIGLAIGFTFPFIMLGIISVIAATAIVILFYKFTRMGILGEFGSTLNYFKALMETDPVIIENKLKQMREQAYERYKHLYSGDELKAKVDEVSSDDNMLGVIYTRNYQLAIKGQAWRIWARFFGVGIVGTFICVPLVLVGIFYGQAASIHYLDATINGLLGIFDFAFTVSSKACTRLGLLICAISAAAYAFLFSEAVAQTAVNFGFGVSKTAAGAKQTRWERAKFQWNRVWNSTDNGGQTFYGRVAVEQKEVAVDEDGEEMLALDDSADGIGSDGEGEKELMTFAAALSAVFGDAYLIAKVMFLTTTASIASFVTTSVQGVAKNFQKLFETAKKDLELARENVTAERVEVTAKSLHTNKGDVGFKVYNKQSVDKPIDLTQTPNVFVNTTAATLGRDEKVKLYIPLGKDENGNEKILRVRVNAHHNKENQQALQAEEIQNLLKDPEIAAIVNPSAAAASTASSKTTLPSFAAYNRVDEVSRDDYKSNFATYIYESEAAKKETDKKVEEIRAPQEKAAAAGTRRQYAIYVKKTEHKSMADFAEHRKQKDAARNAPSLG